MSLMTTSWADFPDVKDYHPHKEAIKYAIEKEYVHGYPDGNFQPDWTISRSEFLKLVYLSQYREREIRNCNLRLLGFHDVPYHEWYTPYVCFARAEKLIRGYPDKTFRPLEKITFTEAAKILAIAFGMEGVSDVQDYAIKGVWFKPYVDFLAAKKAIPRQVMAFERKLTRGQAVEMLHRLDAPITTKRSHTYDTLVQAQKYFDDITALTSAPSLGTCPTGQFLRIARAAGNVGYQPPEAQVGCDEDFLYVFSNGMPSFPFTKTNKNWDLQIQDHEWKIPRQARISGKTRSLPIGTPIGVAVDGLPLHGPNEEGRYNLADPFAVENLDSCNGHVNIRGEYHYHGRPDCLWKDDVLNKTDRVIGYAWDGFPIMAPFACIDPACSSIKRLYSSYVQVGDPTDRNAWDAYEYQPGYGDLDKCNGMVGPDKRYRYYATDTFPYLMGCYRGHVETSNLVEIRGPGFKYRKNHPFVKTRFLGHRSENYPVTVKTKKIIEAGKPVNNKK